MRRPLAYFDSERVLRVHVRHALTRGLFLFLPVAGARLHMLDISYFL